MTYILLAGVVVVWGLIFVRIYNSMFSGNESVLTAKPQLGKVNYTSTRDTFELIANYRDPFLGGMPRVERSMTEQSPSVAVRPKPAPVVKVPEPEVVIDWSVISYIGLIKNPATSKHVSLMLIKGNEYMMAEGETRADVKLIKNCKDSVKVLYSGKEKFIKRN